MANTYSQGYATQAIADDAAFRVRGKWFSDRLTDIGWAKTADTGQINWTTVTKAAGGSTSQGYEIRKSNDGLTDIYCKIEYGSGVGATDMGFWLTFGEGSDGAGALTGDKTTRQACISAVHAAVNCTDYLCGTTARFVFLCGANTGAGTLNTSVPGGGVQRTTDASGVDDSTGFIAWAISNGAAANQYVGFAAGASAARTGLGGMLYCGAPIPGSAGAIPVFPLYVYSSTQYLLARDLVAVPTAYAAMASTHTFSLLGSNRTWIGLWGNTTTAIMDPQTVAHPATLTLCLRWE